MSMILFSILWNLSTDYRFTFFKALTDTVRGLTGQSSNSQHLWTSIRKGRTKRLAKWLVFQMLLYIWIIVSTVICKSMSSVLLMTFIEEEPRPFVNSLRSIIRKNIEIEGIELLETIEDEVSKNFWKLLNSQFFNNKSSEKMAREASRLSDIKTMTSLLNGQMVQLDNSKNNREKLLMFPNLPLAIGRRKYGKTLLAFFINKNAMAAKNVTQL